MAISIEIWKLIAGIVIFIMGMRFLEEALKQIAGRPFKLFLRKHTTNKVKGILGGAVVTGILQSSSVVNIMVLAFVGAGVISMQNALALMLGSNLGTTLTSWLIATIGFKINIESLAFPLTGIAGLAWSLTSSNSRFYQWLHFLLGFGLLLIGLQFMKEGATETVKQIDLTQFNQYPAIIFLLCGVIITSLVQSSSATVALVLSAIYTGGITLYAGCAIVLGAEIGTTIKLLIAAQGKMADKKRVAFGNFLFNTLTTIVVFFMLTPFLWFITETIGIKDNLIALVFFQSTVNIISIILFFPLLNIFGNFLQKRFTENEKETRFLHLVKPTDQELALQAMEKEVIHFIYHVIDFFIDALELKELSVEGNLINHHYNTKGTLDKYEFIKELHGDIHGFYLKMQGNNSDSENVLRTESLISAVRNAMYGAKSMKDGWQDALLLRNSSNESKFRYYKASQGRMKGFLEPLLRIMIAPDDKRAELLERLYYSVAEQYTNSVRLLYKEHTYSNLNESEITTIINYNRELYTAKKSILLAVKDFLLGPEAAARFNDLPGFIR
ncbi:Na/Pi symporter [Flavihumibacter sediminis]|nr:Na/Pi symporter [Flavihumibacter sediminis]